MTKEEILAYLKSKQQFFYDNFGIKFIGLFGSFLRDEAKDSILSYKKFISFMIKTINFKLRRCYYARKMI